MDTKTLKSIINLLKVRNEELENADITVVLNDDAYIDGQIEENERTINILERIIENKTQ